MHWQKERSAIAAKRAASLPSKAAASPRAGVTPMCVCARAESHQSRLTLYNPVDCSPPGSQVHGILQARGQEWAALPDHKAAQHTQQDA